jgi:hypothetical protein
MQFQIARPSTLGAEIEAVILDRHGNPADFDKWLHENHQGGIKFPSGSITVDLARWQVEFQPAMVDFNYPEMLFDNFCKLEDWLRNEIPGNWDILYKGEMFSEIKMAPVELRRWMSRNPRYKVVIDALESITPGAWDTVTNIMLGNATHLHFSNGKNFDPFRNDGVVQIMNHLNHIGLLLAAQDDEKNGVCPHRNSRLWSKFAPEERLPSARVWGGAQEYRDFVTGIPQLVSQDKHGEVHIDLKRSGNINDPLHRSTLWHGVRATGVGDRRWIEYRYASSMPPERFISFAGRICNEVEECIANGPQTLSDNEWRELF